MHPDEFPRLSSWGFFVVFLRSTHYPMHQYFKLDSVFDFSGCSPSDGGERKSRCTLMNSLGFQLGVFYYFLALGTLSNGIKISS
jgi:hypothetical protein